MKNFCDYSDEWQPYIGDYDKFEYDITLHNGDIVTNCYPNGGKFNSLINEKSYDESEVNLIRFSEKPIMDLNSYVSKSKPERKIVLIGHSSANHNLSTMSIMPSSDSDNCDFVNKPEEKEITFKLTNPYKWSDVNDIISLADGPDRRPKWLKEAKVVQVRIEPKIGRNDMCKCGSGKKYKNCCI